MVILERKASVKTNGHKTGAALSPALKELIDRAIVPALVKKWLAENRPENPLAQEAPEGIESATKSTATTERVG